MEVLKLVKHKIAPKILMQSGSYFDFIDLYKNEFTLDDIAHALSNTCRFGGHTGQFYSVAQHSVLVSKILPDELAFIGLMHDAAEAFLGDIPTPLKQLLPDYIKLEERVQESIFSRFNLPINLPEEVKHADLVLLSTERRDLMPKDSDECWECLSGVKPLGQSIDPLSPTESYKLFKERCNYILKYELSTMY